MSLKILKIFEKFRTVFLTTEADRGLLGGAGLNRFCKKFSVYPQLKCVTDRPTNRQTDRWKRDIKRQKETIF